MTDEVTDDNKEMKTPPDPSTEEKTPSTDEKDGDEKEPMIPKHRLDEEADKRRVAEDDAKGARAQNAELEKRLQAMADAITGKGMSRTETDDEVADMAKEFNVPVAFLERTVAIAEKRAAKKFQEQLKPVQFNQAEAMYAKEFQDLTEEVEDVANLTVEQKKTLKDMAFNEKYARLTLAEIFALTPFGRQQTTAERGKSKTAESGRGGARRPAADSKPIEEMSMEEFETYSDKLGKTSG